MKPEFLKIKGQAPIKLEVTTMNETIQRVNETLTQAAKLKTRIIGIYGSATIPEGAVSIASLLAHVWPDPGKCFAKALFTMAMLPEASAIYVGGEASKECCWAAGSWLGYQPMPPRIEEMLSMGNDSENVPTGMCFKDTPALARETLADLGVITPFAPYLVAQPCSSITNPAVELWSVLCFGNSEQIRLLSSLVHFGAKQAFTPILGAWGSGCATFVAYPAGLVSNSPKDSAFISPMAPEAHSWFPEDMLALGIPISIAIRMAENYPRSFAAQHPESTYPANRIRPKI